MSIAFNGTDTMVLTFSGTPTMVDTPVVMGGSQMVKNGKDGVAPVGILRSTRGDYSAIQVKGYARVKYNSAEALPLGWDYVVCDNNFGLRIAKPGETGRLCLVVEHDTTDHLAGVIL